MHYRKVLHTVLLGLTLLVGLLGLPVQGAAQGPVTVTLSPVEVGVAEVALLEARIDCPPGGCGSFHIILSFDRELIRVRRALVGPYLGDQAFEAGNTVDNPAGKVDLAAESATPPPDADNLLFTLEVYGLVPGTAVITVDSLEVNDVTRNPVAASSTGGSVEVFETGKIAFFSPPSDDWEVAFVSDRDGNPEIYAMSADGSNVRRLTDQELLDGGPQWSPDGSRIAFFSARDGNLEIYVMDENGDNLRRLTENDAPDYNPAWSPNGTEIVFVSERDGTPDLYVMPAAGGEARRLTSDPGIEMSPAWSPDGREIAYNALAAPQDAGELYLMNADGSNPHRLIDLFGAGGWHPDWSPNGSQLSLSVGRDEGADVYTLKRDGTDALRLTDESSWLSETAFAPDGNWIAYMAGYSGFSDLYVIDTAGEHIFRLTETQFDDTQPDWRSIVPPSLCAIWTDQEDTVTMNVGPGINRGEFGFLPANQNFRVEGQALDDEGHVWYKLDKTQIPGTEMVNSLWVAAEDVLLSGDCVSVPFSEVPPIIPGAQPTQPGTWGPCGSCECGHPGECVTSPDGQCLWDPATCHIPPPPPPDYTPPPGSPDCYRLARGAQGPGSVSVSPGYNCPGGGGYSAGTVVTLTGIPDPGAVFTGWSGDCPGINPSANPMSITMTQTCSVTGHFSGPPG